MEGEIHLAEWLRKFRAPHERARNGTLSSEQSAAYVAGREELARALIVAQGLAVDPSQQRRKALRVARALQGGTRHTTDEHEP